MTWDPGSWPCHICKQERPDNKISVRRHTTIAKGGIAITQNVRYCNDRESCIRGSVTYRHFKET